MYMYRNFVPSIVSISVSHICTQHRLDKSAVYNLESEELTHHGKSIYDLDSDEEITKAADVDSEGVYVHNRQKKLCISIASFCMCA